MAGLDTNIISRIQQANDIVDVVSEHVRLSRKGSEMVGLCPFHEDHRPSMYVNPSKQIFKCFACGAGGDVLKFVQMREHLTFGQALERLAARAGIEYRPKQKTTSDEPEGSQTDRQLLQKINAWAVKFFQAQLRSETGRAARRYISQRQISSESCDNWKLGFAPDGWDIFISAARAKGITDSQLLDAGFAIRRADGGLYDRFRNRLMFPIIDSSGREIGFGGRTLGDDPAKYINSPATALFDKSNAVYGLDRARHKIVETGSVIVVEGYTDVIMPHQFGFTNVVATLGTSFTAGHARLLRRYAKQIVLVFDSDTAGTEASSRALDVCLSEGVDVKITFVPQGKDPCDFLVAAGASAFEEVLTAAVDVMEYQWSRLQRKFEASGNLADRRAAAEEFINSLAAAIRSGRLDALQRGLIINKLAGITGMDAGSLNARINSTVQRFAGSAWSVENQKVVSINIGDGFGPQAQRQILEVLLNEPRLYESAVRYVNADSFDVPALKIIWKLLSEAIESQQYSPARLLGMVESVDIGNLIVQLQSAGEQKGNYADRLKGAIKALAEYHEKLLCEKAGDNEDMMLRSIAERRNRSNLRSPGIM